MPPEKGKKGAKRSYPDAEEGDAERQMNVHVNIHPAPPEEDMPAEAVQPTAEAVQLPSEAVTIPTCHIPQRDGQLQAWFQSLSVVGVLLCKSGCHSEQQAHGTCEVPSA